jgi:hypothetical protein
MSANVKHNLTNLHALIEKGAICVMSWTTVCLLWKMYRLIVGSRIPTRGGE